MKTVSRTRYLRALQGLLCALFLVPSARAQQRDEYGDVRDIRQTVARISFLSGNASYSRGDDPDDWQPADRNVPLTLGDRVYTGSRSRLELYVHGGDAIRLGARTDLAALNLTDDTKQFSVKIGVASFQIRRLAENEIFEVDTPNAAVNFERPGDYRVDVDSRGNTRLAIREGSATVAAGGGQIRVEAGEGIQVDGLDAPRYDFVRLSGPDGWDQWVEQRESRFARARSYQYVSADIVGVDDLDEYGRWQRVPEYGWVWSPSSVDSDWVPYRVGHWIWQDPWGWSWVSAEPWGWAPYHYGRWVFASSRWCWVPVAPSVRVVAYSPALVAFVGGGAGWSLSVSAGGGGFIGWFPLGPSDPFVPWWGIRSGVRATTITNVAFVNRTYVTVVNRTTFVSGGVVTNAVLRDRAVITQVASAPVLRGPVPAVPTAGALHVAVSTQAAAAAPRPPAEIVSRAVVARVAPPPAPPTFQAKLAVITENHGAPVAPATAARISVENRGRPQTVSPVNPVAPEGGRVMLAPRSTEGGAAAKRPEPVTAFRGRPMATSQQPVAPSPVTGTAAPSGAPAREVAPRERVAPAEPAPQAPPGRGREREVVATPIPAPGSAAPPGERARPQSEEWRQRVQPTQPPPPGLERQREPAPPREQAPQPPAPGLERQRERPTPPPEAMREGAPERRREAAPTPQQGQPSQQPQSVPPGVERRRERPTPPPEAPREGGSERRREVAPPPQAQQPTPPPQAAPERRREGGPPPQAQQPPPPPQGESRPQVERGRAAPTPKPEEQKKGKKEEKKDEKEKKPTPSS